MFFQKFLWEILSGVLSSNIPKISSEFIPDVNPVIRIVILMVALPGLPLK